MVKFRVKKSIFQLEIKQWSLENRTPQCYYAAVKSSFLYPRVQTQARLNVIEAQEEYKRRDKKEHRLQNSTINLINIYGAQLQT